MRTTVWHEMTHWLWDEAGRADAPPLLAQWRRDLEQHFRERTANDQPEFDKRGFWFLRDEFIDEYAGKVSNHKPTDKMRPHLSPVEMATVYMQEFAQGGVGAARWITANKSSSSTFELVISILGDKQK